MNFVRRQHIFCVLVWNTSRKIRFVCHSELTNGGYYIYTDHFIVIEKIIFPKRLFLFFLSMVNVLLMTFTYYQFYWEKVSALKLKLWTDTDYVVKSKTSTVTQRCRCKFYVHLSHELTWTNWHLLIKWIFNKGQEEFL